MVMDKQDCLQHLGPLLGYCNHRVLQRLGDALRQYDVTPIQCRTLTFLHEAKEPVNQRTLEQFLHVKPSTVNGIVTRLEEKGFLRRQSSAADGRCRILTLTEQGAAFYDTFRAIVAENNDFMEQGFTPDELDTLRQLLLRLAQRLAGKEEGQ